MHFSFFDAGMQDSKRNSPTMSSQATAFAQKEAAATTVAFAVLNFLVNRFGVWLYERDVQLYYKNKEKKLTQKRT